MRLSARQTRGRVVDCLIETEFSFKAGSGQPLQVDFSDDGTSLKTNIACGKLVVIGFVVPGNFESGVGSNGIMPTPDESPSPGGHCVVVYGYHTDADGTLWLDIRNSWSAGWGDAGDFHAKFTDLAPKVSDAWTC